MLPDGDDYDYDPKVHGVPGSTMSLVIIVIGVISLFWLAYAFS